jgi:uncharacterized protein DUF4267
MATSIGFYLSALIAAGIIFIGGRFLLAPSLAAAGYGIPAGTEPHSRAYLAAKGIRDIASGLFVAMLIAFGSAHALGWFMLIASIIPLSDAVIVLHQGGSRTIASVAILIISGLLLIV